MELDVEEGEAERFELDPVYENIAAPKYWDFGRLSDDGTVDKWFEDPNTAIVESPAAYHEPKKLLKVNSAHKKSRSVSGSPLRLRQKQGHPPTSPGRAQRRQVVGPSPLRKSVLSLTAMAAAAVSASPFKVPAVAPPANDENQDEPNVGSPPSQPADRPSPVEDDPVLPTQPEVASVPSEALSTVDPIERAEAKAESTLTRKIEKPVTTRPPLPASAADAFAQAMSATLAAASQPLFMRRNKKPLEPLQTTTGGARRVPGRDLPGPARPADVSKAVLRQDMSVPLESSAAMQENVGVGGQIGGQRKPPAGPKPGHVRLRSSRGRSLDDRSWKGAAEVAAKGGEDGRRSENGEAAMLQRRIGAENKADARSVVAKDPPIPKKSSLGRARSSGGSVRSSLGEMDENAKGGVGKLSAQLRLAPTAVGRLKGRKSETAGLVRASSPRVEKVRAAWKLRRSINVELGAKQENSRVGGGKKVADLLEERMNNLSIAEDRSVKGDVAGGVENAGVKRALSPRRESTDDQPPPSSMEKAGQLLRRMGAAVGALLGSVSPLEKQKPTGGEGKAGGEEGKVACVLQFEESAHGGRRGSFLAAPDQPKPCTGVEPEEPEESPREEGEKMEGGRGKRRSLLQRLGGASRKARERSHTPRGRAKKEGARKRGTPGGKAGTISHARPLAVRLTLKEKERRLAVVRRMAKLEQDSRKHAVTMGWLRSSAIPLAAPRPAAPPAPPKVTHPHPFPLRTEERGAAKLAQWQAAVQHQRREEEAARIPHAHPLPPSLDVPQVPPKPVVKHSTVPAPFDLDSVRRHEAVRARIQAELDSQAEKARRSAAGHIKPRPASSPGAAGLSGAARSAASEAEAFALRTDQRAAERREFDQLMADKIAAAARERDQAEQRKREREEAEVAALRRSLVVRAQPMPFFDKPFKPRKSTKGLTVPHSPKFSIMSYEKANKAPPPPTWKELFGDHGRP
ncbi:hypothetical protein KFL_006130060 [Klebsormidium nitens]|uniref:TPX2 C-terminal domain-containing protein n=1 Tax=Klebsormidium nitens TaxID=105231 RepID=A0A1Y1IL89_KLENI|nr:hypothetical protein KFL_006130060 [Klebsormidium nitens]|eukprot:GAQ90209.1 hypothetical protein KFL_006130060 [Klebsormidium nitens]